MTAVSLSTVTVLSDRYLFNIYSHGQERGEEGRGRINSKGVTATATWKGFQLRVLGTQIVKISLPSYRRKEHATVEHQNANSAGIFRSIVTKKNENSSML